MWKGTAATLKPRPTRISAEPIVSSSGFAAPDVAAVTIAFNDVDPCRPEHQRNAIYYKARGERAEQEVL